jgi:hypothetical protein
MSFGLAARATTAAASLLVLGCASAPVWYDANPMFAVHVWGGFVENPASPADPQRAVVLIDASQSMRAPTPPGPSRVEVARTAASRFVLELPEDASVRVSDIGFGGACAPPRPLGHSAPGTDRIVLAGSLAGREAGAEGSIAQGLVSLAGSLGRGHEATRVVAFTDLNDSCGGDLCAAATALESAGASLDLVVIGEAQVPDCVGAMTRSRGTTDLPATLGERPIPFRVLLDGAVAVEGRVGDAPVEIPAAPVTLVVDLDPPLLLGPMRISPDTVTRLEILDFPHATPPVREWRWEALLVDADPEKS